MKDPNEMTLDECRDELARAAGWSNLHNGEPASVWHKPNCIATAHDPRCPRGHPVASTLDAIAAAMPEGWEWGLGRQAKFDGTGYEWRWWVERNAKPHISLSICRTGNEKLDRARLAVACWRAMKGPNE